MVCSPPANIIFCLFVLVGSVYLPQAARLLYISRKLTAPPLPHKQFFVFGSVFWIVLCSQYQGSVDENVKDVVVMRIKALDKDLKFSDNWTTVFKIEKGNEDGLFSIETDKTTNEGILKLIKVFRLVWCNFRYDGILITVTGVGFAPNMCMLPLISYLSLWTSKKSRILSLASPSKM